MRSAPDARAVPEPQPRLWHRYPFGFRLTLGYALLFSLSAVLLFALMYALLGGLLEGQDRAYARTQLRIAAEAYTRDGLAGVRRHAALLRGDDQGEEVLFRVADARNRTRLLVPPDDWRVDDFAVLEAERSAQGAVHLLYNAEEDEDLEAMTERLPDGGYLQVGVNSDERDDVLESFPRVFLVVSLPLLLLALLGGAFMAYRALRPIRQLIGTLDALVATSDVKERAPTHERQGEFAELFRLFNRMLDRIESLVARLGATLDDVAHDLRTPLTRVRGTAELALQRERAPEAYREALAEVVAAAEAATATLDTIMDVSEAEAGTMPLRLAPVSVADLVADVAELYGLAAEARGIALDVQARDPGRAAVDAGRMRQAIANLVDNAVKYTPQGGRVAVAVDREGEEVRVAVRDTGPGIVPEALPWIWDRLYRGEEARHTRGLGLGLSLVRAIVKAHGGRVSVESQAGGGAAFTIHLPAAPIPYGVVREP